MSSLGARLSAWWGHSVRRQLIVSVALVLAVFMTVLVFDLVARQRAFLRHEAEVRAESLARNLAVASVSGMLANDIAGLGEILGSVRGTSGLDYACILDSEGRVLAHTRPELVGRYVSDPVSLALLSRGPVLQRLVLSPEQVDLAMPIIVGSRRVGWARVDLNQGAQRESLERVTRDGLSYTLVAIFLGTLGAYFIAQRLSSGLERLVAAVDAVRSGERGVTVEEDRPDELGRLGAGFNAMLAAVREGEEKFRTVADFTHDWEYWRGPDGSLIWMSPSCAQLTGYAAEEFQRDPDLLRRLVHPLDRHLYDAHMHEVEMGSTAPGELDFRVLQRSGRVVWIDHHCQNITRPDGTLLGRRVSNRDITLRKVAEEERGRWAQVFNNAAWGIFICPPDGRTLEALNPAFARMHGHAVEELSGRPAALVIPEELRAAQQTELARAGETGHHVFEAEHVRKDGSRFPVQMDVTAVKDERGAVAYHVVNVQDITERRRGQDELIGARDAAEAANKAKSDFLAVMSHELRTPLNGIKGMLQVLREGTLTESERGECLEHALAASDTLAVILNDVLDVTRIEAGKMRFKEEPFLLEEVAAPACAGVETAARIKNLHLTFSIDPALSVPLLGDAGRIRQILLNLLGNAVKFSTNGEIALEIYPISGPRELTEEGRLPVHFVVRDSGIGIAHEHLRRIFEPFTQVESPYTRLHGGAGLGLAIVKRLTDLMGGRVEAYSELAQGTEVHLTLPLRLASEAKEPPLFIDAQYMEQAMRELCQSHGPLRVLVVEDDRLNQLTALKYLEMIGCEGKAVSSGAEALEALSRERFDAVLMDVQMPGMDGLETTRRIRAGGGGGLDAAVPVVAVTAHARREDREQCLRAGMDAFVPKPCTPEDLREALLRVVRRG